MAVYQRNKKCLFYQDETGEWRWKLVAHNGNTMADSGEGYKNYDDMRDVAASALDLHPALEQKSLQQDSFVVQRRMDQVTVVLVAAPEERE